MHQQRANSHCIITWQRAATDLLSIGRLRIRSAGKGIEDHTKSASTGQCSGSGESQSRVAASSILEELLPSSRVLLLELPTCSNAVGSC